MLLTKSYLLKFETENLLRLKTPPTPTCLTPDMFFYTLPAIVSPEFAAKLYFGDPCVVKFVCVCFLLYNEPRTLTPFLVATRATAAGRDFVLLQLWNSVFYFLI